MFFIDNLQNGEISVSYDDGTVVQALPPMVVVAFPSLPAPERPFSSQLKGLCSNYDGIASNDFIVRGKDTPIPYPQPFTSSWIVDTAAGDIQLFSDAMPFAPSPPTNPYDFCPAADRVKVKQQNCNFKYLVNGCRSMIDMATMYANCFQDYCVKGSSP